ncbi:hypothetical protein BDA99DRAFT_557534 [Phascolomyces articulosus]|uniref:Uncharacterized protein n=1 Tax=Phascolomyces articulosus TaxID=60185 RepID=A0AAD5KH66_9FUNG|nr:hypothetical protein BDA99DRAFT_557534 [Phascolomyces articulosus]
MRFTTTFTSIATCSLLIVAILTNADQRTGNSLAFVTPEQQNVISIRPMLTNQMERRRLRLMARGDRYQEEPEEYDEEEEEDEEEDEEEEEEGRHHRHRSSSRLHRGSGRHSRGRGRGSGRGSGRGRGRYVEPTVQNAAEPAVHKVSRTSDKLLSKVPLTSTINKTIHGGRGSRSRTSGTRGRGSGSADEEEEGGLEDEA